MAEAAIREEFGEFLEGPSFTANMRLVAFADGAARVTCGQASDLEFTVRVPADYPQTSKRFVFAADDDALEDWVEEVNNYCKQPSASTPPFRFAEVLEEAANLFADMVEPPEEDHADFARDEVHADVASTAKSKPTVSAKDFFLPQQGSSGATMRLLSDLENVKREDWGRKFGFEAELCKDEDSGMPDLYHWHIKLAFDKGDPIHNEMQARKLDHVLLDLQFPFDYPNSPPFVRVIRPRFAFHTGHVTIGGSICMEVLTQTGWLPTNDVESVIVQIRAEMNGGGARLDQGNHSDYSEQEAFAAFDRVAGDHRWKVPNWSLYRRNRF